MPISLPFSGVLPDRLAGLAIGMGAGTGDDPGRETAARASGDRYGPRRLTGSSARTAAGLRWSAMDPMHEQTDEQIDDTTFEDWVFEAIDALPAVFRERLGSVAIVIEEWPTETQLSSVGAAGLYGLYQGVPRSVPGADHSATPSKITIFRGTLERHYRTPEALREKVIDTVHHEIAHHFGISDARLHELASDPTTGPVDTGASPPPAAILTSWTRTSCWSRTTRRSARSRRSGSGPPASRCAWRRTASRGWSAGAPTGRISSSWT